jgi:hypothetical protein
MCESIKSWFENFKKEHIVDEFPKDRPEECFECNRSGCENCEALRRYRICQP